MHSPDPLPPGRRDGHHRGRRGRAAGRHSWRRLALALPLVVVVAACGVRLDTPPPELPSADAAETARQFAAARAAGIAVLAESVSGAVGGGEAPAAVLDRVASDAREHALALGGLWSPPAWAIPAPDAPGTAGQDQPAEAGPGGVVDALSVAAASACADAVLVEPEDLATLLASICLSQARAASELADAAAVAAPSSPLGATTPDPAVPVAAGLGVTPGALELARALDAGAFALEVAAARADDPTQDLLEARASALRASAHALVVAAGALGTAEDPRRAAYDLTSASEAFTPPAHEGQDPVPLAVEVETGILEAWVVAFGTASPELRPGILAEMAAAEESAHALGARSATFPGIP